MTKPKKSQFLATRPEIEAWLKEQNILRYTLDEQLRVNIKGSVNLRDTKMKRFPVQFGVVEGDFVCAKLKLKSLKGAPREVEKGFDCSHNQLTSLIGGPQKVGDKFMCAYNQLTTLEGGPLEVGGYYCHQNQLISLKGAPVSATTFNCDGNQLTSLEGGPKTVLDFFHCAKNKLKNFTGAPRIVGKHVFAQYNEITEFGHIFSQVKEVLMAGQHNDMWLRLENEFREINLSMAQFNVIGEKDLLSKQISCDHVKSPKIVKI